jgi:hypothetical protein
VELRLLLLLCSGCTSFERLPTFNDGGVSTTPQVLADGRAHPQDLVVMGGFVMWVDQGTSAVGARDGKLLRAPVEGCRDLTCPEALASDLYSPAGVALSLDGAHLYFSELADVVTLGANTGHIWQIDLGVGAETPSLFAMGQDGPTRIAADQDALYWVNHDGGEVRRQWLDMGTPGGLAIAAMQDTPMDIAVDVAAARVYWTDAGTGDFGGAVHVADPDGQNERTIAQGQAITRGLSLGPTYVYWANAGNGTVMRALPTGMEVSVFASDRRTPNDLLVDGDWIYLAEGGTAPAYLDGRIVALKLDGSAEKVLADDQKYPRALAMDGSAVYWVNVGSRDSDQSFGAVMRVAKP